MGNHKVGQIFHAAALVLEDRIDSFTQKEAVEKLDIIGNLVKKITSSDAEFDDYLNPNYPLGKWVVIAFAPELYNLTKLTNEEWSNIEDSACIEWCNKVKDVFSKRYDFW